MIRKLRTKFVCIVMAIALLMVSGILGVVIYFTGSGLQTQSISQMRAIASGPVQHGGPGKLHSSEVRLPYLSVQLSERAEILDVGGNFFDLSDEAQLRQLVTAALAEGKETGTLTDYQLRYLIADAPKGYHLIFADTTAEAATMKNLICGCVLLFFGAMAAFLGISILLSHWAIKPVEQAWEQQRQFVADASHELKTPLSVILANAELLQAEQTTEAQQKSFSQSILTTSYQMRSLVESLLEMARVDNGTVKAPFSSVELSQVVENAVMSFQLLYREQQLQLESTVAPGICVYGSERQLYQVLDILLDNGLKYSTPRGTVSVSLRPGPRSCLLCLTSPGTPLSKQERKDIFKRFYRIDPARAMNGSYGLGLSIAEAIVTAHKGKIWAESDAAHNHFYVQLPL